MIKDQLNNKKFLILGLGVSGYSIANFFAKMNITFVSWDDKSSIRMKVKKKGISIADPLKINFSEIDYIIVSPGISHLPPDEHFLIRKSRNCDCKIISDLEIIDFLKLDLYKIAITGTNGKSTTTSLIEFILNKSRISASACGNIGKPVTSINFKRKKKENLIIEASSYQLERINKVRFNISVLLNISIDHIERHKSMKNYINAKLNIFKNQKTHDHAIICIDDEYSEQVSINFKENYKSKIILFSTKKPIKNGVFMSKHRDTYEIIDNFHKSKIVIDVRDLKKIRGEHNLQNLLASYIICRLMKIEEKIFLKFFPLFKGLEHRLEYIGKFKNINIYNDSKATNINSSIVALKSLRKIYWILGGRSKAGGLKGVEPYLKYVKRVFIFGEAKENFYKYLNQLVDSNICKNLEVSIQKAYKFALNEKDEVNILFSPACSSFDQFKNFEERGKIFKNIIKEKIYENENKFTN